MDTPGPYQEIPISRPNPTSATHEYGVEGMTCSHCADSVREEVSEVPGVRSVDVDLASGRLTVSGDGLDEDAIRAAVADAGYALAR